MNITFKDAQSYAATKKDNLILKRAVLEYQKSKRNAEEIKKERMVYESLRKNG